MTKIVYSPTYGGYGISYAGVMRYAEIKGITLYPESDPKYESFDLTTYWLVPPSERTAPLEGDAWYLASMEERVAHNAKHKEQTLDIGDIPRHDPALVQMVEDIGDAASGQFAKLRIAEVPSGTLYRIDEYDGNESVCTNDSYDWIVAP